MSDPISIFPLFVKNQTYPPTVIEVEYTGNLHKKHIHNAVVNALLQGIFIPISYDRSTKLMVIPETDADAVPPASIATNEVTSVFGIPERNRRERIQERGPWNWQAIVKFNREVVLELFEENLTANPILIPADPENGLRQIRINLVGSDYIHPPKQSPSSGTQVVYSFEARLGPV